MLRKVEGAVQDVTAEELHWVMTRTFRTWLAQSYSECDEVCDALESEQQRLKRTYHSKEQELGKMRAHASQLKARIVWAYQVFMLAMAGSMATGCAGAWRAISTGQFWPSVQVMAFAWLVMLATAVILLFGGGDGPTPRPPVPSPVPSPTSRGGGGSAPTAGGGGGPGGGGGSSGYADHRERERRAGASAPG